MKLKIDQEEKQASERVVVLKLQPNGDNVDLISFYEDCPEKTTRLFTFMTHGKIFARVDYGDFWERDGYYVRVRH